MEFIQEIRVPKERIAVLIGKKGFIKRKLQSKLEVKINIDSNNGLVSISGEDNLHVYDAKNVIQSIARGFNPEISLTLLNDNICFESVNIADYSKNSKSKLLRLRSRVIGREGTARKNIEMLTHCHISVYGKTVSIIGPIENVQVARKGIEHLLRGSKHANVYYWIEQQKGK
ncbi:MAG: KH domain-containing protein [Nanoarchaeota archaeon]|nr:KH domain-containing protein [Nanoarchaeota archaeon]MBU0962785.1 KH domain-containing protein [Nanoarchaeota archaeon]